MSTHAILDSELAELQEIIREDYGVDLEIDKIRLIADRLVGLYEAVFSQRDVNHD